MREQLSETLLPVKCGGEELEELVRRQPGRMNEEYETEGGRKEDNFGDGAPGQLRARGLARGAGAGKAGRQALTAWWPGRLAWHQIMRAFCGMGVSGLWGSGHREAPRGTSGRAPRGIVPPLCLHHRQQTTTRFSLSLGKRLCICLVVLRVVFSLIKWPVLRCTAHRRRRNACFLVVCLFLERVCCVLGFGCILTSSRHLSIFCTHARNRTA